LDDGKSSKISDWNKQRKELEKSTKESNNALATILNDIMSKISMSQDNVSKALSGLYKNSYFYSETDIARARLRKELGNPPGKSQDPLGDQFSWELLLNVLPKVDKLWIVSNDMDYFTENNKTLHLNPVLYNDVKRCNEKTEVKTFNTLSDALRDFDKIEKIQSIPSEEELNEISKTEEQILSSSTTTTTTVNYFGSSFPQTSKPTICPGCRAENSFNNGAYLRSQYGGLTLQFVCMSCGFHYDTGDFFD
jgi:hypothetical protein